MADGGTWTGLRLGTRLLLPRSRAERGAVAWLVLGSAVVMVAITVGFGLLQSLSTRAEVVERRSPSFVPTQGSDAPLARVRVLDTGGGEATIYELGPRSAAAAPPPGVPSWPAAGEVWLSPAAAEQRLSNPYLAALVPGRDVGRIRREGLRDPDDVVAVVGVREAELARRVGVGRVSGFGSSGVAGSEVEAAQELSPRSLTLVWTMGLAAVVAGAAGLMIGVGRVADAARTQRLAVLQLLGAPLRMIRAVAAAHALGWSLVGALVGLASAWPIAHVLSGLGLFGVTWWPSRFFNVRVVAFSLTGMAIIAAWGGARSVSLDGWRTRRRWAERPLSPVRLAPLIMGTLVLTAVVVSQYRHRHIDVATPPRLAAYLVAAAVLCCCGVALAAPLLTRGVVRLVGDRFDSSIRVAAARVDHHVRETSRMGLALVLLVLVCAVVLGASQSIAWQSSHVIAKDRVLEVPAVDDVGNALPVHALDAALRAEGVRRAEVHRRSGATEGLTTARDKKPSDLGYTVTVRPAAAAHVAAAVQRAWPDAPPLLTDRNVAGDRGTALMSGTLLVCLCLTVLLVLMALGVNLVGLQLSRQAADVTLLAIGMSAGRLAAVRWWEVAMAALPGPLLATLLAIPLGVAVMHLDHTNVPLPGTFALLPGVTVVLVVTLAGMAALLSPRLGGAYRRSE